MMDMVLFQMPVPLVLVLTLQILPIVMEMPVKLYPVNPVTLLPLMFVLVLVEQVVTSVIPLLVLLHV
jgi:hypothetical protein